MIKGCNFLLATTGGLELGHFSGGTFRSSMQFDLKRGVNQYLSRTCSLKVTLEPSFQPMAGFAMDVGSSLVMLYGDSNTHSYLSG